MSSRSFSIALALVLVGLGASVAASWVHFQLAASPGYISFCDVNATFSCAEAYQSDYGRLLGIPVAVLGAAFFLGLLLLMTLGRQLEALAGYLFLASIPALGVVLYLAWATVFVLGTLCLLCLATYAAVIGLFFVAGAAMPFPLSGLSSRLPRDLTRLVSNPLAIAAVLVVVASTAAAAFLFPADPGATASAPTGAVATSAPRQIQGPALTEAQKAQVRAQYDSLPRSIVPADAAGASVVVVKFNDYQCPPCRQTWELYRPVKAKWDAAAPGKVRFITRDFPLEPECNAAAPGGSHQAACEAAVAVRLARGQDKVDAMETWLFSRQASLTPALVRQGVEEVTGITDFDARYAEQLASVRGDASLGATLGVNSTPTFFINGVKVPGMQPQMFDYLIEYELSKVTPAAP